MARLFRAARLQTRNRDPGATDSALPARVGGYLAFYAWKENSGLFNYEPVFSRQSRRNRTPHRMHPHVHAFVSRRQTSTAGAVQVFGFDTERNAPPARKLIEAGCCFRLLRRSKPRSMQRQKPPARIIRAENNSYMRIL
jgi:hypothetical protein